MPVGVLRSERPQLRQIIACERAALEADRFHWTEVLRDSVPRVQPEMSNLQSRRSNAGLFSKCRSGTKKPGGRLFRQERNPIQERCLQGHFAVSVSRQEDVGHDYAYGVQRPGEGEARTVPRG